MAVRVMEPAPELSAGQQRALNGARRLATAMDAMWGIGRWRIGLETFTDFVPFLGDAVSVGVSLYQLGVAQRIGLPRRACARMALNAGVDLGLGAVPVVGDVGATLFKAHLRNQRILDAYAGLPPQRRGLVARLLRRH